MATSLTPIAVRCLSSLQKHRLLLWALTALLSLAAFWSLLRGIHYSFTNDLGHAFPTDSQAGRMYSIVQESGLTQALQLELSFDAQPPRQTLKEGLLRLEEMLPGRHINSATAHFDVKGSALAQAFLVSLPLTNHPDMLKRADPRQAAAALRRAMTMPGTPIADLRADPFGLRLPLLQRLADFQASSGLQADLTDGFLISPAGDHALVLIEPNFNGAPAASDINTLLLTVEHAAAEVFPQARRLLVSPLKHNLENEHAVRDGIFVATLVSIVLLFLLFLGCYRGAWDALWLPCLPFLSTLLVTGLMALIFREVCLYVVGIGAGIAGLAIDQCIHVFVAYTGKQPLRRVAALLRPLGLSTLTSAAVFLLVATTGISAYRQLGVFAALILAINLLLSLAVLPGLLKRRETLAFTLPTFRPGPRLAIAVCLVWLVLVLGAASCLPHLKTNFSLSSLDGTSAETRAEEKAMLERWRSADASTMVVATGQDEDTALARCEALETATAKAGLPQPFHPALLWPSRATRQENLAAWQSAETRKRLQKLQASLQQELSDLGLPPNLCDAFFDNLRSTLNAPQPDAMPEAFRSLRRLLLRKGEHCVAALAFAPGNGTELLKVTADIPGVAVASAEAFQQATWTAVRPRLLYLGRWLLPVLLLALLPLLRRPAQLLIVALPGLTALLLGSALAMLCGYAFNLVTLFSLTMLTGLVLDYGLFALHLAHDNESSSSMPTAMLLSALTSIATTAALTTSRHPVMFHTGLVLSLGILLTALTALLVVPSLLRCTSFLRGRKTTLALLSIFALLLSSCRSTPPPEPSTPAVTSDSPEAIAFRQSFLMPTTRMYTMKTSFLWHDFTLLVAIRTSEAGLQAVGMTPNGMTLFSVARDADQETRSQFSKAIPTLARKLIFGNLAQDLSRIFLETPGADETYGGEPVHLTQKHCGKFPKRQWQAVYYGWCPQTKAYDSILYHNFANFTTLTLKQKP